MQSRQALEGFVAPWWQREGGNGDGVLPDHLQNGPAILTADFPVISGEINYVPPAPLKIYEN
jgi:hypothetical protein